jgi:sigma-B regulation protein RsbU (phosphoserine phosphatase)
MAPWTLQIESVKEPPRWRELDRERLVIGRGAECDVQLPDQRVSRQHLEVELRGDELWVQDLGSRAGTRLNGKPVQGSVRVNDRDLLELSDESRIVIRRGPAATARTTATGDEVASGTVLRDAASMLVRRADLEATTSAAELRRLAEQLHLINEIHQALSESPSRSVLLDLILDRIFANLRPEQASVLLVDESGNLGEAVTRPAELGSDRVLFSRSLLREMTERRQAALVLDAAVDERFSAAASILHSGVRSVLAAPLLVPSGVLGMIVLSSRLRVRQFDENDLQLLVSLASAAALHLRNLDLAAEAAERHRLASELELARHIQLALLPSQLPDVPGYEMRAGNVPSRGVSGDLYAVDLRADRGLFTCLVCDVAGKGMAASLLGASLEALAVGPMEVGLPPDAICERVSRRLYARTPPEKYATGFIAQIDSARHGLTWANAGHNSALLVRTSGEVERLATTGPPLGLLANATFQAKSTELGAGDLVLIYTDGITEASNPDDEEFGIDRLSAVLQAHRSEPLDDVRHAIESELETFVQGVPYADDRTMLFLRRRRDGE